MTAVKICGLRRGHFILAPLLATTLLIECGGGTGSITKADGSAGQPSLTVGANTLNFGSVLVGGSKALPGTLTAKNASVKVSSAEWSGQGYSVSGISFPATVPAGQSVPFTVTFAPQTAGNSSGSISFLSNASNSPSTQTLTGDGTQPATHSVSLSWSPSGFQVIGYNVYRGTQNGGPYLLLTSSLQTGTSYDDTTVQSGLTYFYVATSVDSRSVESPYSNQTTVTIP